MSFYQGQGYGHPNPAYGGTHEKQYRPDVQVPMAHAAIPEAPRWSWCSTGWSIFALFFCNTLGCFCNFMALLYSIWAYVDHKTGDVRRATTKLRFAIGCVITGIILSLILIVVILALVFLYADQLCDIFEDVYDIDYCPIPL